MTDHDPVVERALDRLWPAHAGDPDRVLARASDRARARRRVRLAVGAALVAGALVGTAVAAPLGLDDWLGGDDETHVRFVIDPDATYVGPRPEIVRCVRGGDDSFECREGGRAGRSYRHSGGTQATPLLSRETMLEWLDKAEQDGWGLPPEKLEEMRRDAEAVSGDFYDKLHVLEGVRVKQTAVFPRQLRGRMLVPPAGVPAFLVCLGQTDGGLDCRTLLSGERVPVEAPVYRLEETGDWVERPAPPYRDEGGTLVRAVFGRDLTPTELRLALSIALIPYPPPGSA